jgi:hypothetical protein
VRCVGDTPTPLGPPESIFGGCHSLSFAMVIKKIARS